MLCSSCGTQFENAKFCPECGAPKPIEEKTREAEETSGETSVKTSLNYADQLLNNGDFENARTVYQTIIDTIDKKCVKALWGLVVCNFAYFKSLLPNGLILTEYESTKLAFILYEATENYFIVLDYAPQSELEYYKSTFESMLEKYESEYSVKVEATQKYKNFNEVDEERKQNKNNKTLNGYKKAYITVYFVGAINFIFGLASLFSDSDFLKQMGVNSIYIIIGCIFLILAVFIQRKSLSALIITIAIFGFDAIIGAFFIISSGSTIPPMYFIRIFFIYYMIKGISAIKVLKAEKANILEERIILDESIQGKKNTQESIIFDDKTSLNNNEKIAIENHENNDDLLEVSCSPDNANKINLKKIKIESELKAYYSILQSQTQMYENAIRDLGTGIKADELNEMYRQGMITVEKRDYVIGCIDALKFIIYTTPKHIEETKEKIQDLRKDLEKLKNE